MSAALFCGTQAGVMTSCPCPVSWNAWRHKLISSFSSLTSILVHDITFSSWSLTALNWKLVHGSCLWSLPICLLVLVLTPEYPDNLQVQCHKQVHSSTVLSSWSFLWPIFSDVRDPFALKPTKRWSQWKQISPFYSVLLIKGHIPAYTYWLCPGFSF